MLKMVINYSLPSLADGLNTILIYNHIDATMNLDRQKIEQLVISVAKTEILPRFNQVERQYKTDGSIVTEADHIVQLKLQQAFKELCPDTVLLGEEMTAEQQQALFDSGQALWCLDPVDGTSNFAAGVPYFAVSLALIDQGEIVFGLVYDPIHDECFSAVKGQGAWLNNEKLNLKNTGFNLKQTIALIDFKRLPKSMATQLVTDIPFGSQRSLGSIALELCWIAAGRAHIYLHGKQQLWDYAAAQLILLEAGGMARTLENEPVYNKTLSSRSTIAAVDQNLFNEWLYYLNNVEQ